MTRRRRWLTVGLLVATPAAALVTYVTTSGPGAKPFPAAQAAVPSSTPAGPTGTVAPAGGAAPAGRLTETAPDKIRPDAPLSRRNQKVPAAVAPARLHIAGLGIDTGLVRLGLAADGTMAVPASAAVAGWYSGGPAPGQVGPAVIAGHVDSHTGPGVFYRLGVLRTGDPITVQRGDGRGVRFVVTGVERFAKAAFPTARVYGPTPFPELRLVTCGGTFDAARGHYRDNVVVFARQLG